MRRYCSTAFTAAVETVQGYVATLRGKAGVLRTEDEDAIHDTRVASRRLRAALAEYGSLFGKDEVRFFRGQIQALTRTLGAARELDVSIALLEDCRNSLNGPERLAANYALRRLRSLRKRESRRVSECCDLIASPEFSAGLDAFLHSCGRRKQCQVKNAKRRVMKRFQSVVGIYHRWASTQSCEELHLLRIAFKKLRYTCEVYQKTYGREMAAFISGLKEVQDWIGDWHDQYVVAGFVTRFATEAPPGPSRGMPELQNLFTQRTDELLGDFGRRATVFFEPEAAESALRVFDALRHDCCWRQPRREKDEALK